MCLGVESGGLVGVLDQLHVGLGDLQQQRQQQVWQ
jgi:hypothetical protein